MKLDLSVKPSKASTLQPGNNNFNEENHRSAKLEKATIDSTQLKKVSRGKESLRDPEVQQR